jgi:branched-chain amino acid transport system permease protein
MPAFLMLTLAIVSVMSQYANQATDLTGGDNGPQGIRLDPIVGVFEFNIFGKTAYFYALVVLFCWFVLAWRIVHSPFGRSLDGIRQNPHRMRAIGTSVWWRLLAIYTISAAMAGSAGALSAHATRFVGLSVLDLLTSGTVTVALILGGTRRLYGGFVGATIYLVAQDYSAKISPFFWEFVVGRLLIATVVLLERGLLDLGRPCCGCATAGGRSGIERHPGPVGSGPCKEVRCAGRCAGDRSRPRARRPVGADRAQRGRQNDLCQPADGLPRTR